MTDELWNAVTMAPGVVLGMWEVSKFASVQSTCVIAPMAYIMACFVAAAFHTHVYLNRGKIANVVYLRSDMMAQLVTCAATVIHTPFGMNGVIFVAGCAMASCSLDLRRSANVAYAINGVCFVVSSGVVPLVVYGWWCVTFVLFLVNGVVPNPWSHAGFHVAVDVTLHEVWRHMRCDCVIKADKLIS